MERSANERNKKQTKRNKELASSDKRQAAAGDLQLPGFVYDAERRRYFRIPHTSGDQVDYLMGSASTSSSIGRRKESGYRSLTSVKTVCRREMNGPSAAFERFSVGMECNRMQMRSCLKIPCSASLATNDRRSVVCDLIGGGPNDAFVVVNFSERYGDGLKYYEVTKEAKLVPLQVDDFYREDSFNVLVDMVLKKNFPHVIFLETMPEGYGPDMGVHRIRQIEMAMGRHASRYRFPVYRQKKSVFSVAYSEEADMAAFGYLGAELGGVEILAWRGDDCPDVKRQLRRNQRFHSLCFVNGGRDLIAGSHRGDLHHMDTRICKLSFLMSTGSHLLCDMKSCGDDRKLVCSGYGGYMGMVDLRLCKTVCTFDEHVNNGKKTRVSVDGDVIACTGTDGHTRMWSSRIGGKPLFTFDVPPDYDKSSPTNSVFLRPSVCHENPVLVVANSNNVFMYS